MNKSDLLIRLSEIIDSYIDDASLAQQLKGSIAPFRVKYVLGELEIHKKRPFTQRDEDDIKGIYFNFC